MRHGFMQVIYAPWLNAFAIALLFIPYFITNALESSRWQYDNDDDDDKGKS